MIDWVKDRLVPEAGEWWRLWSARFMVLAIGLDALQLAPVLGMLPPSVRDMNPMVFDGLQMLLVGAALAGRFVRQPKVTKRVEARTHTEQA